MVHRSPNPVVAGESKYTSMRTVPVNLTSPGWWMTLRGWFFRVTVWLKWLHVTRIGGQQWPHLTHFLWVVEV